MASVDLFRPAKTWVINESVSHQHRLVSTLCLFHIITDLRQHLICVVQQVTFTTVRQEAGSSLEQPPPPHPHNNPLPQQPHHQNPPQQQQQQRGGLGYFVVGNPPITGSSSAPGPSSSGSHVPVTPIGHEVATRNNRAREAKVAPYIPKTELVSLPLSHAHPSVERIKSNRSPRPDVSTGNDDCQSGGNFICWSADSGSLSKQGMLVGWPAAKLLCLCL